MVLMLLEALSCDATLVCNDISSKTREVVISNLGLVLRWARFFRDEA